MENILLVFVHNNKEFLPKMSFFFLKVIYFNSDKNVNTAPRVKPVEGAFQASERPGFAPALQTLKTVEKIMKEGRSWQGCTLLPDTAAARLPQESTMLTSRKRTCAFLNLDHTAVGSAVCRLTVKRRDS